MYSEDIYAADRMLAHTLRRRFDAARRVRWVQSHVNGPALLDVGAGTGYFVAVAAELGFSALGIEPSGLMARHAREKLGANVLAGLLTDGILEHERYDAICAWHVLEHVRGPVELLQQIRRRLAPGGRVFIEVPNIESVGAQIMGGRWAHLDPQAHLMHFAPNTLVSTLERAGLRVLITRTLIEGYYDPPRQRLRPRRVAGRVVRGARLRTTRLVHPSRGELLQAIASAG